MDCNFYVSFYPDLADLDKNNSVVVNEHYINVGMAQGRVTNKSELNNILAKILHFDLKTFTTANLSPDNVTNLLDKYPDTKDDSWVNYYYNENTGNLYNIAKHRVINSNDIKLCSNKWEIIYSEIFKTINFNLEFYKSFYVIPSNITNTRHLKINWLKNGLFNKQYPNIQSLNTNENIVGLVQTILMTKFGLDMAHLSEMKNEMLEYASTHRIAIPPEVNDESRLLLFLFFNTAQQLRLFFNLNERTQYINERKTSYNNAIQSIKSLAHVQAIDTSNREYLVQELQLLKVIPFIGFPIIKGAFCEIISTLNIVKLTNNVFIDCFKKIQQVEDIKSVIIKIVNHEMTNYLTPVLNSMEMKIFVISLVYNLYIENKVDKKVYLEFVKTKSIEILTELLTASGLQGFETVLESDMTFIIENKKIIKLSYAKNLAISFAAELFVNFFG
jgi:hypothetical protein